jgi:hypothetical protein
MRHRGMRFSEFPGVGRTCRVEGFRLTAAAQGCTEATRTRRGSAPMPLAQCNQHRPLDRQMRRVLILIHSRQRPDR